MPPRHRQTGFTLVEMIIVMVLTGIIGGIVAVFIRQPVDAYFDTRRRAGLVDAAETILWKLELDLQTAVPNSVRVNGLANSCASGTCYLEFIASTGGGRLQDVDDHLTGGTGMDFGAAASTAFDVLGPLPALAANDIVVANNLGPGYAPGDAYSQNNTATVTGVSGATVTLDRNLPAASPNRSFQVIPAGTRAVTYGCNAGAAGNMTRYWNYGLNASQPMPPTGGTSALAGENVRCSLVDYSTALRDVGLLAVEITVSDPASGESVTLAREIRIDNRP